MKIIIKSGGGYMQDVAEEWQAKAKGILKAELKRRNLGYKELAEKLNESGLEENERNLANKVSRGSFTAGFFLHCLAVIGCQTIRINEDA